MILRWVRVRAYENGVVNDWWAIILAYFLSLPQGQRYPLRVLQLRIGKAQKSL